MQKFILGVFLIISAPAISQELFVFSEPASNIPARSISVKLTDHLVPYDRVYARSANRFMPELMLGFHKKFMMHIGGSFSNMHTSHFKGESIFIYGKYRFLSADEVHQHFRMAVFAMASQTNAPFHFDEVSLMGDRSGIEAGLIATQLWNKFALSGTVSHTEVLNKSRFDDVVYVPERIYRVMDGSISAGYLLFPREYTNYKQVNVNFYIELLAQQALGQPKHYIDLAPAVQLIFNSNAKLNMGYRVQLGSTMQRMTVNSWLISFERTFLNALKFKKRR